jgi:diaminopimelate epimerase
MLTVASASGNIFLFVWKAGLGDGAVFDGAAWAKRLCPRGHGLGVDGLFLMEAPEKDRCWAIEHWDSDGSKSFCSNGTRAAGALLPQEFWGEIEVCSSGEKAVLNRQGLEVGLRLPQGNGFCLMDAPAGLQFPAVCAWTGTPQLVLQVPDVDAIDLPVFAPPLRFHPSLPCGANVSVLQVLSLGKAKIRTWERGVEGETQCCGQGAAAAAAWLAERTGLKSWEMQPRGADRVLLEVGTIEDRHWDSLWLRGLIRVLGEIKLGLSLRL